MFPAEVIAQLTEICARPDEREDERVIRSGILDTAIFDHRLRQLKKIAMKEAEHTIQEQYDAMPDDEPAKIAYLNKQGASVGDIRNPVDYAATRFAAALEDPMLTFKQSLRAHGDFATRLSDQQLEEQAVPKQRG